MGKYFGTDGFRGLAGVTITSEQAFKVGRFLGWYFGSAKGKKCRAVIGKDTRISSYTLEYALAAGITASGGDAYIMHVTTTPSVSFVTRCEGFDCGIMISASHNYFCDNGIKLMNCRGGKMEDGVLSLIEDYIDDKLFIGGMPYKLPFSSGEKMGKTVDYIAGRNRYIGHLIALSTVSYKGVKVGLDCANGASYKIAKSVFDALGAETFVVGGEPNGLNVNDGVGATNPYALQNLVRENRLDIGFAFDGDADRCICCDERGNIIDGDGVLYVFAKWLKERGELIGDRIVATVMSNSGLAASLANLGVTCERCAVGDRFVYDKMCECGAVLGGEQSGHIILSKFETTGDGLVTAIMLMEALIESKGTASSLTRGLTLLPQKSISVHVKDKFSAMNDTVFVKLTEKLRAASSDRGRIIVRPSGTEEVIRIMAEFPTEEECENCCSCLEKALKAI